GENGAAALFSGSFGGARSRRWGFGHSGNNATTSSEGRTSESGAFCAAATWLGILSAGELLGCAQRQEVSAELVVAVPLEMPVVYGQVAELAEVADDVLERLVRVEGKTLLTVAAAIGLFRLCHIYPSE